MHDVRCYQAIDFGRKPGINITCILSWRLTIPMERDLEHAA